MTLRRRVQVAEVLGTLPQAFDTLFMQQWLCACAVFPGLRLTLTMQLGRVVADWLERPWPCETEILEMSRLSWFREGRMPDEVRLALLGRLDQDLRAPIRSAIEKLIFNILDRPALAFTPDLRQPPASWHQIFVGFLGSRRRSSLHYDVIYRQFMLGCRPSRLDMLIDDWAQYRLGERIAALIDLRGLAAALASIVLAATLYAFPYDIGERVEKIISSPKRAKIIEFTDRLTDGSSCVFCPPMVMLPPGSFVMGSPTNEAGRYHREGPQRQVTLSNAFAIGKFEATFDEYDRFAEATNRRKPSDEGWGRGDRPVINVTFDDAVAYCHWLGTQTGQIYDLPTEAEWEYAARAGTRTATYTGDLVIMGRHNAPVLDAIAWYGGNSGVDFKPKKGLDTSNWVEKQYPDWPSGTHPVGRKGPNAWGLHDMIGNVREWVADSWHGSYQDAPTDGRAWVDDRSMSRVARGGSWHTIARRMRSAYRYSYDQRHQSNALGFRCARALKT